MAWIDASDWKVRAQKLPADTTQAPGAPFVEYAQQTKFLSPAMKEMAQAILERRLHHAGHPIFRWNVGNVEAKEDNNDGRLKGGGPVAPPKP